jgi:peroxiredoxin
MIEQSQATACSGARLGLDLAVVGGLVEFATESAFGLALSKRIDRSTVQRINETTTDRDSRRTMAALEPDTAAPQFSLPDDKGEVHSLTEGLAKGPLLLVFFKVSCPTCQYALPFFERLHKRLAGAAVNIWAVSQDSLDHTNAFGREFGIETLPVLFDPEEEGYPVSNVYGITNVPTAFLVEPDGRIAVTSVGWSKDDVARISRQLGQAAGEPGLLLFEPSENVLAFRPG